MTKQTPDPADERSREELTTAAGASRWKAPAAGSSRPAKDLATAAEQLLTGGNRLDSAALRDALLDLNEFWLTTKAAEIGITATSGFAIVATGGLGRGELLPFSDLDLTLIHDGMPDDVVSQVAELLWYPLWDANIHIDHSVRTVPEALQVAGRTSRRAWPCSTPATSRATPICRRSSSVVPGASGAPASPPGSKNSSNTRGRGGIAAVRSPTAPNPT